MIKITCWDLNAGLEGSRFYNDFVLAVFSYFMLSEEIEQDILMGRFEIGCYIYDVKGNACNRFFNSKFALHNTLISRCSKQWSN